MAGPRPEAPAPAGWKMPDAYLIIFAVIVLAAALTYVVPAGSFETREKTYVQDGVERTREVLVPESFQYTRTEDGELYYKNVSLFAGEAHGGERMIHRFPSEAEGDIGLFNYAFEGLVSGNKYGAAVGVVAFILVIGGSFGILLRTGAVEAGILAVIARARNARMAVIPVLFVLFSLGGAVFGMGEEAIAFAMIVVPLMVALGYDSITGVLITYGATQIGFATSWMNPFSVAIAQGIADVPVLSGAGLRAGMWAVFTALGLAFTLWHALRVQKNPQRSLAYESDDYFRQDLQRAEVSPDGFRAGHGVVLAILALGLLWVLYGVIAYQYYIPEIATQFFIIGILSGVAGVVFRLDGMGLNDIPAAFRKGAGELLGAALVVGMAKGILLLLGGDDPTTPNPLNTILHGAGTLIGDFHAGFSAWMMFLFQSLLNFFVSSGSGQAALTMPLMAPLADLAGVQRQVAVLAFQLGDGLTNLIIPTSAALMGTLGVARLDYATWLRFQWPFQLILFVVASLFVLFAVAIGFA